MKKAIISIISMLCVGLMIVGPIRESYANDLNDTKSEQDVVEATNQKQEKTDKVVEQKEDTKEEQKVEKTTTKEEQKAEKTEKNNKVEKTVVKEAQKTNLNTEKEVNNVVEKEKTNKKENTDKKEDIDKTEQKEEVKEETNEDKVLTKSEALQLVKDFEPSLDYDYMGDENTYECIKENGIKGYVFLPQCEGDMAYLVDKETGNIYFFHPSGYFELLK